MVFQRKSLLSYTALISLACVSFSGEALAQRGAIFSDGLDWSVNSVTGQKAAGNSYCTLSRNYSEGATITVAKNKSGQTSFAFAFSKPGSITLDNIDIVTLDPGAGGQRALQLTPLNDSSFVTKVGEDQAFIDALKRTGFLRVEAGQQVYNFSIPDFANGQSQLSACLSSLQPEIAVQSAPAQPVEGGLGVNEQLSLEDTMVAKLEERISQLIDENASLRFQITNLKSGAGQQDQTVATLERDLERLRQDSIAMQAQLEVERNRRTEEFASISNDKDGQIAFLQQQVEKLKTNLQLEEKESSALPELAVRIRELVAENDILKTQNDRYLAFREENAKLQQELTITETRRRDLLGKIANLEAEKLDLMDSLSAVSGPDVNVLRNELAALNVENERLASRLSLAKKAGQILLQNFNAEKKKTADLSNRLELAEIATSDATESRIAASNSKDNLVDLISDLELQADTLKTENVALKELADLRQRSLDQTQAINQHLEERNSILMETLQAKADLADMPIQAQDDSLMRDKAELQSVLKDVMRAEDNIANLPVPAPRVERAATAQAANAAEAFEQDLSASMQEKAKPQDEGGFGFMRHSRRAETPQEPIQVASRIEDAPQPSEITTATSIATSSETGLYDPVVPLNTVLSRAGLVLEGGVEILEDVSDQNNLAYQWTVGEIYGSAEQTPLLNVFNFDDQVKDYLTRTETRCAGDFAIMPADTVEMGDMRVDSYDIACLGDGIDATASLLFFNQDGTFSVVAHEAPSDLMDIAMDIRDKLADSMEQ